MDTLGVSLIHHDVQWDKTKKTTAEDGLNNHNIRRHFPLTKIRDMLQIFTPNVTAIRHGNEFPFDGKIFLTSYLGI